MDVNDAKSVLNFCGYTVEKISFINKSFSFENGDTVRLDPEISRKIQYNKDTGIYIVTLTLEIGKSHDSKMPFELEIEMSGHFSVKIDNPHDEDVFIKQNAVAILFPYLRALTTNVTVNANMPPVVLPTLNITKLFDDHDNANGFVD